MNANVRERNGILLRQIIFLPFYLAMYRFCLLLILSTLLFGVLPSQAASVPVDGTSSTFNYGNARRLVRDTAGNLYLAYVKDTMPVSVYVAKSGNEGATWTVSNGGLPIANTGGFEQCHPQLAIDSNDTLHCVFYSRDSSSTLVQVQYVSSSNGGTSWSPCRNLQKSLYMQLTPAIVVDAEDNLHCVWSETSLSSGTLQIKYSVSRNGGSTWSDRAVVSVASAYSRMHPSIAVDSKGGLHCVSYETGPNYYQIVYSSLTAGASLWCPWFHISPVAGAFQYDPCIAIDSRDNIHCVWYGGTAADPYTWQIKYSSAVSGGYYWSPWQDIQVIPGYSQSSPSLAVDANDGLHCVWHGRDQNHPDRETIKYSKNTGSCWSAWATISEGIQAQRYPAFRWSRYNGNGGSLDIGFWDQDTLKIMFLTPPPLEDNMAPAAVTSLSAAFAASGTQRPLTLTWTSPGDDGWGNALSSGSVTIIRYYSVVSSTTLTISAQDTRAGAACSRVITGLSSNTTYFFGLWTRDGRGNTSSVSNQATAYWTSADTTPPEMVTTLSASFAASGLNRPLTLSWTAPGDDGWVGAFSSGSVNIIQYYTAVSSAMPPLIIPIEGQLSRVPCSQVITGLSSNTTYYFRLWIRDGSGNLSECSNVATAFWLPADLTPPHAVTSLSAQPGTIDGQVRLTWTSPPNDGWLGGALTSGWTLFIQHSANPSIEWLPANAQTVESPATANPGTFMNRNISDLLSATTYFFRVWCRDEAGNMSEASNIAIAPAYRRPHDTVPPAGFKGIAISSITAAIIWSWTDTTSFETGFQVLEGTTTPVSSNLPANTISWVEWGLQPNTPYTRLVTAKATDYVLYSLPCTKYTFASVPQGLTATIRRTSSISLTWTGDGTRYAVERSLNGINWTSVALWEQNVSTGMYLAQGLAGGTTYWFRVRAYNGDGELTAPASPIVAMTAWTFPEPVADLAARPLDGAKIQLSWTRSVSPSAAAYNIYYADDPLTINFSSPDARVDHPAESWTSPALVAGKTYYFAVRTVTPANAEEKNQNIVSASTIGSLTGVVKAEIKIPQNGKKVSGNSLTVKADITIGSVSDARRVLFQYRSEYETDWRDIPAANLNHPNPDLVSPYFVHWDVTPLLEGTYYLRAVATDVFGVADPSPAAISVVVDNGAPDLVEGKTTEGEQKKTEKIDNRKDNTVQSGELEKQGVTQVTIPQGAMNVETTNVSIVTNPRTTVTPPEKVLPTNEYREITLKDAHLTGSAVITIPYKDDDADGILDGTNISVSFLSVYAFNTATMQWEKLPTIIDKENKQLKGTTTHFSLFALFGALPETFADVRAYPNPFKPSKGHTVVKFDNLTANTKIQIFTLAGDLVWERADITTGMTAWNAVNQSGNDVASGVYLCLITNAKGEKKIVKMAVLR